MLLLGHAAAAVGVGAPLVLLFRTICSSCVTSSSSAAGCSVAAAACRAVNELEALADHREQNNLEAGQGHQHQQTIAYVSPWLNRSRAVSVHGLDSNIQAASEHNKRHISDVQ